MKKLKGTQFRSGETETSLITHWLWPSGHKKGCYLKLFYSLHFKSCKNEKQQDSYNEERMKQEQTVRDCSLVKRNFFFLLRWNITWIPYTGAVQFGIFDDQVLNPKGGCCDFWKRKNNYLEETTATSEYTWLLLLRTRCLLQSCLNWSTIFVEIGSSPVKVFHLLWTTICKSSTSLSQHLPIPESTSLLAKHFFFLPLPPSSQSLSHQYLEISKVILCAIKYMLVSTKVCMKSRLKNSQSGP